VDQIGQNMIGWAQMHDGLQGCALKDWMEYNSDMRECGLGICMQIVLHIKFSEIESMCTLYRR